MECILSTVSKIPRTLWSQMVYLGFYAKGVPTLLLVEQSLNKTRKISVNFKRKILPDMNSNLNVQVLTTKIQPPKRLKIVNYWINKKINDLEINHKYNTQDVCG